MGEEKKMSVKMSRAKTILFVIAVWITSFSVMWQMSEVVIINNLYEVFPDQTGVVTTILSWPALITALASLLAGWWMKKVSSKVELIIADILMFFGVVAAVGSNVYWLAICSFIMAFGAGFANTAGMAILSQVFLDEKTRSSQMGYYNAVMAVFGVGITILSGVLAVNGWQMVFNVYWFAVVMLIFTILFIPNIRPEAQSQPAEAESSDQGQKKFGAKFWIFFISMFFFFMSYCAFFSYISVYISENNLGDTVFIGNCSSLTTVGSTVASILFGIMYQKMHRKISLLYIILPLVIYFWAFAAPGRTVCIIFALLYGFSYGGVYTLIYAYAAEIVPPESNSFAMGLMTFHASIAITVGANIFAALMGKMGTITATYPVAIGMLVIALVIEVCANIRESRIQHR